MGILCKLFGRKPKTDYKELVKQDAVIIDVRRPSEFASGHIEGAINIPLDSIKEDASKISKQVPVILCCASGMRSGNAQAYLKKQGYDAYNGGGWQSLKNKLS